MRRSVQPSCPSARTCFLLSSLKMLVMLARATTVPPPRQRLERLLPMAGFEVSTYGRIWVSTEETPPLGKGLPIEDYDTGIRGCDLKAVAIVLTAIAAQPAHPVNPVRQRALFRYPGHAANLAPALRVGGVGTAAVRPV